MRMRSDDPGRGGALGTIRDGPSLVKREKGAFVDAAKLIVWVDVRGEEVAFSRQTVEQNSSMFYFTAQVKGLSLLAERDELLEFFGEASSVVAGPARTVRHDYLLTWTAVDALAYTTGHGLPPNSRSRSFGSRAVCNPQPHLTSIITKTISGSSRDSSAGEPETPGGANHCLARASCCWRNGSSIGACIQALALIFILLRASQSAFPADAVLSVLVELHPAQGYGKSHCFAVSDEETKYISTSPGIHETQESQDLYSGTAHPASLSSFISSCSNVHLSLSSFPHITTAALCPLNRLSGSMNSFLLLSSSLTRGPCIRTSCSIPLSWSDAASMRLSIASAFSRVPLAMDCALDAAPS